MTLEWWRRPVRMMRRDFLGDFSPYVDGNLDEMARISVERWLVNCEWVMATPGCAPGMAHLTTFNSDKFEKVPGLGDFDVIRRYLPHAKKRGLHLLPYVNAHWYSYEFAERHPEYEQQLVEDGTPYGRVRPLYGNGTTFCVNGGWREFAFEMIREVMRTGVEGCFLDGPVVFPNSCYCPRCREGFEKESGFDRLPAFNDWTDPAWKPFLRFRRDSWRRFMRDAQAAAREINPDAVIFLNGGGFDAAGAGTARDIAGMEPFQSFNGAEEFFHCSEAWKSPFRSLNLGRFLSAGENPGVVFTHHCLGAWHYIPLSKTEMTMAVTQTVASGSNTWFAIFMEAMNHRAEEAFAAIDAQRFFIDNERWFADTRSAASTGVLLSANAVYNYVSNFGNITADVGGGEEKDLVAHFGDGSTFEGANERRASSEALLSKEFHGALDACDFRHVPVRALWDEHIVKDKMDSLSTLILPTSACLSDSQMEAVMEFVEAGGSLAAFFESGFYDENGEGVDRTEWRRFLGIAELKGAFVPSGCEDYIMISSDGGAGFEERERLIPRTFNALKILPAEEATVLAKFMNPVGKSYQKLDGVSDFPAVVATRRGKGRVVYCAGALFESVVKFHHEDHLDLFKSIMTALSSDSRTQVEIDAPGCLAVEIRRNDEFLVVHLLNATGDMKRPIGRVVPLVDVRVSIKTAVRPIAVRAGVLGRDLPFEHADGRVVFELPRIDAHEVVALGMPSR